MTLFPKDLSDIAAALSDDLVPQATAAAVPAENVPVDDLGRSLAQGESVLGEGTAPEGLAASEDGDGLPGIADSFEIVSAGLGYALGQSSGAGTASYGSASYGLDVTVGSDSVAFVTAGMEGCGCPMCNGFDPDGTGGSGTSTGAEAPGPAASLQTLANYLRDGFWDDFSSGDPRWYNMGSSGTGANSGTLYYNVTGFTGSRNGHTDSNGISAARQTMAREAFKLYGELMGINFVETTSDADHVDFFFIDNVYTSSGGQRAYASTVLHSGSGGAIDYNVINITPGWSGSSSNIGGTNGYTFQTFLHEIGHAMGLGHQGIYNAGSGNPTYANDAQWVNDTWQQTIMSYWSQDNWAASGAQYAQLVSLMGADWVALNDLYAWQGYGTSNAFNGDTIYGVGTNITTTVSTAMANLADYADTNAFTIVDGSGIDTVDFSNYNVNQTINLSLSSASSAQATLSNVGGLTGNMSIAVGTIIENATTGGGNDTLIGNQYSNVLTGNAGNDSLYGGDADDTLYGGADSDGLVGGDGADYIKGGAGNDYLYGGVGVDSLLGEDGSDWLILQSGHGSFANEYHYGGNDYDTYWFYNDGSTVSHTFDLRTVNMSSIEAVSFSQGADLDKYVYVTAAQVNTALSTTLSVTGNNYTGSTDYLSVYMSDGSTNTQSVDLSGWSFFGWQAGGDQGDRVTISGTALADTITGSSVRDNIYAGDGSDLAYGGTGDDYIDGLGSNDTLYGGIGADTLYGYTGADVLYGGDGADTIYGESDGDWLEGGAGNDSLSGASGSDTLYAGSGTDTLDGGEGTDFLYGGEATSNSQYYGGSESDYFYKNSLTSGLADEDWYGGDGIDSLLWMAAGVGSERSVNLATGFITFNGENRDVLSSIENVYIYNGASIIGSAIGNTLAAYGGFANSIEGGAGDDYLYGGDGNDTLYGGLGVDVVYGGDGDDQIREGTTALEGADSAYGGFGNDLLVKETGTGSSALKVWDGGSGNDTFEWTDTLSNNGWTVNLAAGNILFGLELRDSLIGIENVIVHTSANVVGDAQANVISGVGNFANTFSGGDGNDTLYGGDGNDTLIGGVGTDYLYGGLSEDTFQQNPGDGWDHLYGGAGLDTVLFNGGNPVVVDLVNSVYYGGSGGVTRTINDVEIIYASNKSDQITGSSASETIYGGSGKDTIYAGGGSDQVHGDAGADVITIGDGAIFATGGLGLDQFFIDATATGASTIDGGDGADYVDFSAISPSVTVNLALGTATDGVFTLSLVSVENVIGGAGDDVLTGDAVSNVLNGGIGNDTVYGGIGADTINGASGDDSLLGDAGTDRLDGSGGNDTLLGGGGVDTLNGGSGADWLFGGDSADSLDGGTGGDRLFGGFGRDTLTGGTGVDTFVFASSSEVGLGAASDRILDFTSGQDKLDFSGFASALSFIGSNAFTGAAGQLRYYSLAGVGYVAGDLDGNQVADFELLLINGASVVAGDLIL